MKTYYDKNGLEIKEGDFLDMDNSDWIFLTGEVWNRNGTGLGVTILYDSIFLELDEFVIDALLVVQKEES